LINFYKNLSIIGGFVLLYLTGPGSYPVEAVLRARRARGAPHLTPDQTGADRS
jgi:hypothetical protein